MFEVGQVVWDSAGVEHIIESVHRYIRLETGGQYSDEVLIDLGDGWWSAPTWEPGTRVKQESVGWDYYTDQNPDFTRNGREFTATPPHIEVIHVRGDRRWVRVNGRDRVEDVA
jgi:hypothetical protein